MKAKTVIQPVVSIICLYFLNKNSEVLGDLGASKEKKRAVRPRLRFVSWDKEKGS